MILISQFRRRGPQQLHLLPMSNSGLGDAWVEAGWYDSYCIVRQILECDHMKRAVEAHEATLVAINITIFKSLPNDLLKKASLNRQKLLSIIKTIHSGLTEHNDNKVRKAFAKIQCLNSNLEEVDLLKEGKQ